MVSERGECFEISRFDIYSEKEMFQIRYRRDHWTADVLGRDSFDSRREQTRSNEL